ncbi:MAG: PAS domain S-box protein [Holophaga sp.]|nr:PAS domain S-box protein [Holophaga sp.]
MLALSVVVASLWAFRHIQQASSARKHTYQVLNAANELMSALVNAETGQRGFLLTGNETFLEPYLAVRDGFGDQQIKLRQLTLLPASLRHLDAMAPLIEANLASLSQNIELRRNHKLVAVVGNISGIRDKTTMDSIRAEMRGFLQAEERQLAQHDADFQAKMRTMFGVIVIVSLLSLLFGLSFAYFVYQGTQQQVKDLIHTGTCHLLVVQEETNRLLQQANLNLQQREEELAVTLNSIGDAMIATDAEARVTRLNPAAEKLTGWPLGEAIGRGVDEIFHIINQGTRQVARIPVLETLAKGTVQGLANHTLLIARDGSECAIADSCAPIRDRSGCVVGAVLVFRDVTEEYAAQQTLRDSTALIQTVLNSAVDGIVTFQAESGLVDTANPSARKMFGHSTEEMVGHDFSMLIPELDEIPHKSSLKYYNPSEEAQALGLGREVLGKRRDGSLFPLEIAISEMWLGGQRYFTGTLRDITSRKQAEAELLKAGALQNAIINSANFSSIATDANGVIQIFNVGAEAMLGYTAGEVVNNITPADISDPRELVIRAKALSLELSTPIAPGFEALAFKAARCIEDIYELTYIRKDGSRFPAVVSVTALRDEQGSIIGYLLIGTDNTARKRIEAEQEVLAQRLRDYQFYTRSLFEANMDALMTSDPTGIITDVNKQMEALTGCTRDELIGAPFKNFFTDQISAENSIRLVMSEQKITNYELTARARNGKETVVSYNATTFYDRDRKLQGMFAAARDVTERKAMDQVLQEKNAELESAKTTAEKANLAKSDFLSSMSHELRSPLNAILGFAQLMDSDAAPPTVGQKESIAQILKAGWHLLKLINEILDLAKIESRQVPLSKEPVSLAEVILECQGMIEPQAHHRGITLSFPKLISPYFVDADRTRVKQVLLNLLSNAIKYNRPQGTIEVQCQEQNPGRIRISIRDSGFGLNSEEIAQLFQAFNRLGQETGSEEGTGIGLVVARQLAELMGGTIGVESAVGVGSVFWCELISVAEPHLLGEECIAAVVAERRVPIGSRLQTLLYVEDNPANLQLVEQIIGRHPGIRLLTATDGNQGVQVAITALPDVILMDINLPGMDGYDAMKFLRSNATTSHIPILAVSANAMPRDIEKGLEAGFFRYITKPIMVAEFMDALELALSLVANNETRSMLGVEIQ